jgi:RecA-family ATPase
LDPQSLHDLEKWVAPITDPIIGGGILPENGRGFIYGRYKSMKSLLALYTALCVGDGREWLGFKTPQTGVPVLYLQIEMPHRFMKSRYEGMTREWPKDAPAQWDLTRSQVHIWSEPFIKLDTAEGLNQLNRHLSNLKPKLLIIDPLYKVMSGNILDPNAVRGFLDTMDRTMAVHNISVVVVHHPRKGLYEEWGSDDMLGSVFLSAWADTVIKVTRDSGVKGSKDIPLTLNFDVMRHAEEPIEEMEVMFDSKTMLFTPVETGIAIPI